MAHRDPKFVAQIRALPCMACGRHGMTEAHHVKTRGSGGGDEPWNLLPLCTEHHTMGAYGQAWHRGRNAFLNTFPHIRLHLEKLGWIVIDDRLIPPQVDI